MISASAVEPAGRRWYRSSQVVMRSCTHSRRGDGITWLLIAAGVGLLVLVALHAAPPAQAQTLPKCPSGLQPAAPHTTCRQVCEAPSFELAVTSTGTGTGTFVVTAPSAYTDAPSYQTKGDPDCAEPRPGPPGVWDVESSCTFHCVHWHLPNPGPYPFPTTTFVTTTPESPTPVGWSSECAPPASPARPRTECSVLPDDPDAATTVTAEFADEPDDTAPTNPPLVSQVGTATALADHDRLDRGPGRRPAPRRLRDPARQSDDAGDAHPAEPARGRTARVHGHGPRVQQRLLVPRGRVRLEREPARGRRAGHDQHGGLPAPAEAEHGDAREAAEDDARAYARTSTGVRSATAPRWGTSSRSARSTASATGRPVGPGRPTRASASGGTSSACGRATRSGGTRRRSSGPGRSAASRPLEARSVGPQRVRAPGRGAPSG